MQGAGELQVEKRGHEAVHEDAMIKATEEAQREEKLKCLRLLLYARSVAWSATAETRRFRGSTLNSSHLPSPRHESLRNDQYI